MNGLNSECVAFGILVLLVVLLLIFIAVFSELSEHGRQSHLTILSPLLAMRPVCACYAEPQDGNVPLLAASVTYQHRSEIQMMIDGVMNCADRMWLVMETFEKVLLLFVLLFWVQTSRASKEEDAVGAAEVESFDDHQGPIDASTSLLRSDA